MRSVIHCSGSDPGLADLVTVKELYSMTNVAVRLKDILVGVNIVWVIACCGCWTRTLDSQSQRPVTEQLLLPVEQCTNAVYFSDYEIKELEEKATRAPQNDPTAAWIMYRYEQQRGGSWTNGKMFTYLALGFGSGIRSSRYEYARWCLSRPDVTNHIENARMLLSSAASNNCPEAIQWLKIMGYGDIYRSKGNNARVPVP